eukprot:GDKI01000391.1.p1 GENE.GDKI01000391.1~~GDKI01000391.1.p1  ORF type:complete len:418 (-),score=59.45 GDKI01000391.1:19-1272(-)
MGIVRRAVILLCKMNTLKSNLFYSVCLCWCLLAHVHCEVSELSVQISKGFIPCFYGQVDESQRRAVVEACCKDGHFGTFGCWNFHEEWTYARCCVRHKQEAVAAQKEVPAVRGDYPESPIGQLALIRSILGLKTDTELHNFLALAQKMHSANDRQNTHTPNDRHIPTSSMTSNSSSWIDRECTTPLMCGKKAYMRQHFMYHAHNVLPVARIWEHGSIERTWIDRFLNETIVPMIKNNSTCLEWDRDYMHKFFPHTCASKDSFSYSGGVEVPPGRDEHGMLWYGDVHDMNGTAHIPNDRFDLIISTQVIEHLRDPFVAMQQMTNVLKPGGILAFTGPHISPLHGLAGPFDFYRFTLEGIRYMIDRAGLELVKIHTYGNVATAVALIEGIPLNSIPDEHIWGVPDDMYTQWAVVARKPL